MGSRAHFWWRSGDLGIFAPPPGVRPTVPPASPALACAQPDTHMKAAAVARLAPGQRLPPGSSRGPRGEPRARHPPLEGEGRGMRAGVGTGVRTPWWDGVVRELLAAQAFSPGVLGEVFAC